MISPHFFLDRAFIACNVRCMLWQFLLSQSRQLLAVFGFLTWNGEQIGYDEGSGAEPLEWVDEDDDE